MSDTSEYSAEEREVIARELKEKLEAEERGDELSRAARRRAEREEAKEGPAPNPTITVEVDPVKGVLVSGNVPNPFSMLGILEAAQQTIGFQAMSDAKEQSRIVKPTGRHVPTGLLR